MASIEHFVTEMWLAGKRCRWPWKIKLDEGKWSVGYAQLGVTRHKKKQKMSS